MEHLEKAYLYILTAIINLF